MSESLPVASLRRLRVRPGSERSLQRLVERHLEANGVRFVPQYRLADGGGVLDFCVPDERLVVELKSVGWSATVVLRQLMRYADHSDVRGVCLVTTCRRLYVELRDIDRVGDTPLTTLCVTDAASIFGRPTS